MCSEKQEGSYAGLPKETIAKQKKINKRKNLFQKRTKRLIQKEDDLKSKEFQAENWATELMQLKKLEAVVHQLKNAQYDLNGPMSINRSRIRQNISPIVNEGEECLKEKKRHLIPEIRLKPVSARLKSKIYRF